MNDDNKGGRVPEYTRRAIEKYHKKHDRVSVFLPLGYSDIIRAQGDCVSVNKWIVQAVTDKLRARGALDDSAGDDKGGAG